MSRPLHNTDLHGNAPDVSETALLLIDVINDFSFKGGQALAKQTTTILPNLLSLKAAARRHRVPVIYVNDNAGKWRSDSSLVIKKVMAPRSRGRLIVSRIKPSQGDYVILKPKQSAFYGTPLEIILDYLKVRRLVIAGIAADICVFFTAQDAFVRDYQILIPKDAVAAQTPERTTQALGGMQRLFHADISPGDHIRWKP